MKDVYKNGGIGAFYKGAIPRALKSALNIALQFFLYDSLKRLADVSPDDLKVQAMPCEQCIGKCSVLYSIISFFLVYRQKNAAMVLAVPFLRRGFCLALLSDTKLVSLVASSLELEVASPWSKPSCWISDFFSFLLFLCFCLVCPNVHVLRRHYDIISCIVYHVCNLKRFFFFLCCSLYALIG